MSKDVVQRFLARLHRVLMGLCSGLLAVLLLAEVAIVLLRYCLGIGFLELQDLAAYSFAALVLLALAPALHADRHVRVDVFREHQSGRTRRRVDLAGAMVLLMPVFAVTLYLSLPEVIYSWQILESSKETGGLGGLFLIKTLLPLMCVLMLIQGVGIVVRGGRRVTDNPTTASSEAEPQ